MHPSTVVQEKSHEILKNAQEVLFPKGPDSQPGEPAQ
jgi:hypothetical protein